MPIPLPNNSEKKDKKGRNFFVSRCMESLKNEKRPHAQILAICESTYDRSKKRKQSRADNSEPDFDEENSLGMLIYLQD